MSDVVHVVAGLALAEGGFAFMGRRPQGKLRPGLWEWPGGKVEPGEDPRVALVREWREELDVDVISGALIGSVGFTVEMELVVTLFQVMPIEPRNIWRWDELRDSKEHDAVAWSRPDSAIRHYPMSPGCYLLYGAVRAFLEARR